MNSTNFGEISDLLLRDQPLINKKESIKRIFLLKRAKKSLLNNSAEILEHNKELGVVDASQSIAFLTSIYQNLEESGEHVLKYNSPFLASYFMNNIINGINDPHYQKPQYTEPTECVNLKKYFEGILSFADGTFADSIEKNSGATIARTCLGNSVTEYLEKNHIKYLKISDSRKKIVEIMFELTPYRLEF